MNTNYVSHLQSWRKEIYAHKQNNIWYRTDAPQVWLHCSTSLKNQLKNILDTILEKCLSKLSLTEWDSYITHNNLGDFCS